MKFQPPLGDLFGASAAQALFDAAKEDGIALDAAGRLALSQAEVAAFTAAAYLRGANDVIFGLCDASDRLKGPKS